MFEQEYDDIIEDGCDLDFYDGYDDDNLGIPAPRKSRQREPMTEEQMKARACRTHQRAVMRKAMSEQAMNDVLDWHPWEG